MLLILLIDQINEHIFIKIIDEEHCLLTGENWSFTDTSLNMSELLLNIISYRITYNPLINGIYYHRLWTLLSSLNMGLIIRDLSVILNNLEDYKIN